MSVTFDPRAARISSTKIAVDNAAAAAARAYKPKRFLTAYEIKLAGIVVAVVIIGVMLCTI